MKIPKQIQIAGKKIDIIRDNKRCDDKRVYGEAQYREGIILLQDTVEGIRRKEDFINVTFLHEILHWIFNILNYDLERENEKLCNDLSELLYQVIKQL